MSRTVKILLPGLLLLLAAQSACADIKRSCEYNVFFGLAQAQAGVERQRVADDRYVEWQVDDGPAVGFRFGMNVTPTWGAELTLQQLFTKQTTLLTNSMGDIVTEDEVNSFFHSSLNVLWHLFQGPVVPYLTAGAGVLHNMEDVNFAWNFGLGAKWYFVDKFALRLDAREIRSRYKGTVVEGWEPLTDETEYDFHDSLGLREISFSVSYRY